MATNGIIRVRKYRKASSNAYIKKTLLGIDHRLGARPDTACEHTVVDCWFEIGDRQDLRDSPRVLVFLNRGQHRFGVAGLNAAGVGEWAVLNAVTAPVARPGP